MPSAKERDIIGELYASLCGDPELPADVQRRVFQYGVRANKPGLLAKLASLPGLDPVLDRELGQISAAHVRAAWLARPGRNCEEVIDAVDAAKSETVYAAAAAARGLPAKVYKHLADADQMKTAQALLANPDTSPEVKTSAARTVGRAYSAQHDYGVDRFMAALFTDQMELAREALLATENAAVIAWVGKNVVLDSADAAAASANLELVLKKLEPGAPWGQVKAIGEAFTATLTQPHLPQPDKARLAAAAAQFLKANAPINTSEIRAALDHGTVPGTWNRVNVAASAAVNLARTSTEAEDLAAARRRALGTADQQLATALGCNPAAGPEILRDIASLLPRGAVMRVAQAQARNLEAFAAVMVHAEGAYVTDEVLLLTGQPGEALVALVREYRRADKKIPQSLGRSEYITPSVMSALPLSFTSKKGSMIARRAVTQLLGQSLTDNGQWDLFETLGNRFEGPLENLLLACGYVAAPVGMGALDGPAASAPESGPDARTDQPELATAQDTLF